MVKKTLLVGFRPYKEKKGKVLFVSKYGYDGVTGVAVDTVFANGDLSDKVTEDNIGQEIVLRYRKGSGDTYYVVDLEFK